MFFPTRSNRTLAIADDANRLPDRNLMAPDDFKNLGLVFKEDKEKENASNGAGGNGERS